VDCWRTLSAAAGRSQSGIGLVGAGFILEGLVPQFAAIAIAQVIRGIGATLSDGADDAWITHHSRVGPVE